MHKRKVNKNTEKNNYGSMFSNKFNNVYAEMKNNLTQNAQDLFFAQNQSMWNDSTAFKNNTIDTNNMQNIKIFLNGKSKMTYPLVCPFDKEFYNKNDTHNNLTVTTEEKMILTEDSNKVNINRMDSEEKKLNDSPNNPCRDKNLMKVKENLSDIEDRMNEKKKKNDIEERIVEKKKKNDVKNSNNGILNVDKNKEINDKIIRNTITITENNKIKNFDKDEQEWPILNVEHINTTFKVIGDLKEGSKVKIVDDRYLAEDNSFVVSFSRYTTGQSREKIMSFLNHLFDETKRNTLLLLTDIRNENDIDNKVSELENVVSNMMIFLHKFDTMRHVYKTDTGTHAKLGVIRNKFFTFRQSLFRDLAIRKKESKELK